MKKTYRLLRYRLTSLFISFNIVILYIVAVLRGAAQPNLIPNPDFEEVYEFCYEPINNPGWYFTTSFLLLKNWLPTLYSVLYDGNGNVVLVYANLYTLSNYGTPDLYHSCILLSAFRPFEPNTAGYQLPYSGQGYIGMGIDAIWNRETVRVKLLDTLKKGQGYCFSFHYSLANYSSAAASHLGAVFSRDSFYVGTIPQDIDYDTRVFSDSVLCKDLDTVNWHIYEGHFLAKGGEEWLTLGWLHKTQHISFVFAPYPVGDTLDYFKAYYLIDALELIECPQYGVPDYEVIPPNVISPNGDGINDAFYIHPYLPHPSMIMIFNRWGFEVFRSDNYDQNWQGETQDGKLLAEGTYFYILKLPSGYVIKGMVSLFR